MFFKRKHWTTKLSVDVSTQAQAKARYERLIAQGIDKTSAERRVRAWAANQHNLLQAAKEQDPWLNTK